MSSSTLTANLLIDHKEVQLAYDLIYFWVISGVSVLLAQSLGLTTRFNHVISRYSSLNNDALFWVKVITLCSYILCIILLLANTFFQFTISMGAKWGGDVDQLALNFTMWYWFVSLVVMVAIIWVSCLTISSFVKGSGESTS